MATVALRCRSSSPSASPSSISVGHEQPRRSSSPARRSRPCEIVLPSLSAMDRQAAQGRVAGGGDGGGPSRADLRRGAQARLAPLRRWASSVRTLLALQRGVALAAVHARRKDHENVMLPSNAVASVQRQHSPANSRIRPLGVWQNVLEELFKFELYPWSVTGTTNNCLHRRENRRYTRFMNEIVVSTKPLETLSLTSPYPQAFGLNVAYGHCHGGGPDRLRFAPGQTCVAAK